MRIGFFDPVSKKPYDKNTLFEQPMGGTEATVIRIAEGLAQRGHDVFVAERARFTESVGDVWYRPFTDDKVDVAVILRNPEVITDVRAERKVIWRHDWYDGLASEAERQIRFDASVCVSDTHVQNIEAAGIPGCTRIYNPVDQRIPDGDYERNPVKPFKLLFPSSFHKGLEETLYVFDRISRLDSRFRLYIANPGYFGTRWIHDKRVFTLGPLPFHRLAKHMAESLAIFCINRVFPETFGLVYAEANALGTPAVGIQLGAVPEVAQGLLFEKDTDFNEIAAAVLEMAENRPVVQMDERFSLDRVLDDWESLFTRITETPVSERLPSQIGA